MTRHYNAYKTSHWCSSYVVNDQISYLSLIHTVQRLVGASFALATGFRSLRIMHDIQERRSGLCLSVTHIFSVSLLNVSWLKGTLGCANKSTYTSTSIMFVVVVFSTSLKLCRCVRNSTVSTAGYKLNATCAFASATKARLSRGP
ncbi:hypothetical protein BJV82DRAFT_617931 [Fennellomyces sp. T-0311]|nr:hypothetical protein BJV82DRAFT_617931 [Fennellomyces sp. T-0311]